MSEKRDSNQNYLEFTSFEREEVSMRVRHHKIYSELADIVGENDITDEKSDLIAQLNYDMAYPSIIGQTEMIRFSEIPKGKFTVVIGDYIVHPETTEEVQKIVGLANRYKIPLVPRAGGSGFGHNPVYGGIIVDLRKLNRIIEIDEESNVAKVEAGIYIFDLEDELNRRGYTMEHFPASYYCACLGGFIADRSAGRLSTKYGKIENMVIGMKVVLPTEEILVTPAVPGHAVGPDLNQLFIGMGGTIGIVTEATIKIYPMPEKRIFRAFLFPDLTKGFDAMRNIMQADLQPCLARLYDSTETSSDLFTTNLVPKDLITKIKESKDCCYLVIGFDGDKRMVELREKIAIEICLKYNAEDLGNEAGNFWWDHSLDDYYPGFGRPSRSSQFFPENVPSVGDVYDFVVLYKNLLQVRNESYKKLRGKYEKCVMYGHFSHWYKQGAMLYPMVYVWDLPDDPKALRLAKDDVQRIVLRTAMKYGGAFQHHHGVGSELGKFMKEQWGEAGWKVIREIKKVLDPNNIMNPGQMGFEK